MNRLTHHLGLLLAATLPITVICTGCRTGVNSVEPAAPANPPQMLSDKRIVTDSILSKRVQILAVKQATGVGGHLQIMIDVRNGTGSIQPFTYRIEWFDDRGMLVSSPTGGATPYVLQPRETSSITATAPTPTAKDFRLKIQRSNQ